MSKNIYFNIVEKIANDLNLPVSKHNPHSWTSPHRQVRYVTFCHKALFLKFYRDGTYYIEAGCDMDFETFNTLFDEMKKFIRLVKKMCGWCVKSGTSETGVENGVH